MLRITKSSKKPHNSRHRASRTKLQFRFNLNKLLPRGWRELRLAPSHMRPFWFDTHQISCLSTAVLEKRLRNQPIDLFPNNYSMIANFRQKCNQKHPYFLIIAHFVSKVKHFSNFRLRTTFQYLFQPIKYQFWHVIYP